MNIEIKVSHFVTDEHIKGVIQYFLRTKKRVSRAAVMRYIKESFRIYGFYFSTDPFYEGDASYDSEEQMEEIVEKSEVIFNKLFSD